MEIRRWIVGTICFMLVVLSLVSFVAAKQAAEYHSDQFTKSGICSNCHGTLFGQWDGSMHSKADLDFFYRGMLELYGNDTKGAYPTFCSRCHTPIGVVSGELPPLNGSKLSDVAKEGVQCDFCHVISGSEGIGNASYVLSPGNLKWGNLTDAKSTSHETAFQQLYTKSEYCGMCHNIYHPVNNLTLAATYTEWKESPYAAEGVQCQDCHLTPGIVQYEANPGKAASNGPTREHVYSHYFVGANAFVTDVLGENKHKERAIQYLKKAASLEVRAPESANPGENVAVEVKISNTGAGHKLPTGVTEEREMWLEVAVKDAKGKLLYQAGTLDENGEISPGTVIYHTVFADAAGNPTQKVWLAEKILSDNRIAPKASVTENHTFMMPEGAASPINVTARLHYRSASQAHIDSLFGKGAYAVPVVDMVAYPKAEEKTSEGFGAVVSLGILGLFAVYRQMKKK